MKTRTKVVLAGVLVAVGVAAYWIVPSIPGTLREDKDGVPNWGTGVMRYYYRAAPEQPKLVEYYVRGRMTRSEWFTPDGTPVLATDWDHSKDGPEGWGVFLREDGSIYARVYFVGGLGVNEKKEYFAPDGRKVTKQEFEAGQESNWGKPGGSEQWRPGRTVKSAR